MAVLTLRAAHCVLVAECFAFGRTLTFDLSPAMNGEAFVGEVLGGFVGLSGLSAALRLLKTALAVLTLRAAHYVLGADCFAFGRTLTFDLSPAINGCGFFREWRWH